MTRSYFGKQNSTLGRVRRAFGNVYQSCPEIILRYKYFFGCLLSIPALINLQLCSQIETSENCRRTATILTSPLSTTTLTKQYGNKVIQIHTIDFMIKQNGMSRILERALEKISATPQWVPISWVYWPSESGDAVNIQQIALLCPLDLFINAKHLVTSPYWAELLKQWPMGKK